jgi:diguanylate cyclase (GGDEF)-like protein/PAS domain S-box-containing protein
LGLPRPDEFFWIDLTYFGVVIIPTAFLAFALCYTGRCHYFTGRAIALLSVEPILTLLILWTDDWHGAFFAGKRESGSVAILDGGFWFWFNVIYSYLLIMIGFIILLNLFIRSPRLYRLQAGIVLFGAAAPWAVNAVSIFGQSPFPALELTPIAFTVTGVAFTFGILQFGFLDLAPIARHALVENMGDGMIVLDVQGRVVDINPAASRLIGVGMKSPIGKPIGTLLQEPWHELPGRYVDILEGKDEIQITGSPPRYFDLQIEPLHDPNGKLSGRLVTFREITARKQVELELRKANQRLKDQLAEIEMLQEQLCEQVTRDPLTGLFNRRYLQETLERELARADREGSCLSVIMIDIDHFKDFNDTYGHMAGDLVLRALADLLQYSSRAGDIACRYGGEEFLVVFPWASLQDAGQRADQIRQKFQDQPVVYSELQLTVTLSAGVAGFPQHGDNVDEILRAADRALYQAKRAGRNRVVTCS